MSKQVNIPMSFKGLHFGDSSDYKKLKGKWFEQKEFNTDNFMYKALIMDIKYNPEDLYYTTDGYAGRCWSAEILETENGDIIIYNFRNFGDLVEEFEKRGYKFIE